MEKAAGKKHLQKLTRVIGDESYAPKQVQMIGATTAPSD
jgi:hypothetical protein